MPKSAQQWARVVQTFWPLTSEHRHGQCEGVYPGKVGPAPEPSTGATPFPLVIIVHGGGWTMGDKRGELPTAAIPGFLQLLAVTAACRTMTKSRRPLRPPWRPSAASE